MSVSILRPLLERKIAILPGTRDLFGGPVLIFLSPGETKEHSYADVRKVTEYLIGIPSELDPLLNQGFTVIVDMRNGLVQYLRTILKVCDELFRTRISHVLILKPQEFLEKQKININLLIDSYRIKTVVTSANKLGRYVESSQLVTELDGKFVYNNGAWIQFREKFERYTEKAGRILKQIEDKVDVPEYQVDTAIQMGNSLRSELKQHAEDQKNANFDSLAAIIYIDKMNRKISQEDALEAQAMQKEKVAKLTEDHFMITSIAVINWVLGAGEKWLLTLHEIGDSHEEALELARDHQLLLRKAQDIKAQNSELRSIANRIKSEPTANVAEIAKRVSILEDTCGAFVARAQRQSEIIEMSLRYHKIYEEIARRVLATHRDCIASVNEIRSPENIDQLSEQMQSLDLLIEELKTAGNDFIGNLSVREHNWMGDPITRDYSPGIVHVQRCLDRIEKSKSGVKTEYEMLVIRNEQLIMLETCEKEIEKWIVRIQASRQTLIEAKRRDLPVEESTISDAKTAHGEARTALNTVLHVRKYLQLDLQKHARLQSDLKEAWELFESAPKPKPIAIVPKSINRQQDQIIEVRQRSGNHSFMDSVKDVTETVETLCNTARSEGAENRLEDDEISKELQRPLPSAVQSRELLEVERELRAIGTSPSLRSMSPRTFSRPASVRTTQDENYILKERLESEVEVLRNATSSLLAHLEGSQTAYQANHLPKQQSSSSIHAYPAHSDGLDPHTRQLVETFVHYDNQKVLRTFGGAVIIPSDEEEESRVEDGRRRIKHNILIEHIPVPAPPPKPSIDFNFVQTMKASNDWVQLRIEEMNPSILDVGMSLAEALHLQKLHLDLMARLQSKQENIEELLTSADRLVLEQPEPEAAVYEAMADSLGMAWKDLNKQLQLRGNLLEEAVQFFQTVESHGAQMNELDRHLRERIPRAENQDAINRLMNQHDQMRKALLDTAVKAMGHGQQTITKLRGLGPLVDNPERPRQTLEACQKIEDIMLRLNERRKRVEITWEDRRHELEWGVQASALWKDLKEIEEWLERKESQSKNTDLGVSHITADVLQKEHEEFYTQAKVNMEKANRIYHTAEQLAAQGFPEANELLTKITVLRRRMADLIGILEVRRQLLQASMYFFQSAASAMQSLDSLESEIRSSASGSLPRRPDALARRHMELASKLQEISSPSLAQGRAILHRVDRDEHGAKGIVDKVSELERRVSSLDQLCSAHREEAMARNRQLQEFDMEYNRLHMWLLNVAEAFLATYRDMGTTHQASTDFVDRHKHLATDIINKEPDVQKVLHKAKDASGAPGDSEYAEMQNRIHEFRVRWEKLKTIVDKRTVLGSSYQNFHKVAVALAHDVDSLEAMLRTSRDLPDKSGQQQAEELWTKVGQSYARMRHEGEKFLNESKVRPDNELDVDRARMCVQTLLDHFGQRQVSLTDMWTDWQKRTLEFRQFMQTWTKFQTECRDTMDIIKKFERDAVSAFGRFEEHPNVVSEKMQRALNDFIPNAKKVQAEIENRLKTAETMELKGEGRREKELLINELLTATHRFQEIITWFEVIASMLVTFFRNLHQLDDWTKRVEDKFSAEVLPKNDPSQMEQMVREHEAARQTVSQMIKFATTEGDQIITRSRQPEVPTEVNRECQKLPELINRRVKDWESVWTSQHKHLQQFSGTARVITDLREIVETIHRLDVKMETMRSQVGSSPQTLEIVNQEFREFEKTVNITDQRVRSFLSAISARPLSSLPEIREGGEALRKQWNEFRHRLENFDHIRNTAITYFSLIEQVEVWIREITEYISQIGHRSQNCKTSEEANRLVSEMDAHIKPRQREQEERLKRIEAAALILYGEQAIHKTDYITRKYKEIIDSFVIISEKLTALSHTYQSQETKRRIEAQQQAPKFTQLLKDATVNEGNRFEFLARVSGKPTPDIGWFKDGIPIVNNPDYDTSYVNGVCLLRIEETFTEDSAVFTCRASNPAGTTETSSRLNVKESPHLRMQAPDFVRRLDNATIKEKQRISLRCQVTANPTPAVSWFKDDVCIDDSPDFDISFNNGICQLDIDEVLAEHRGRYTCRATNPVGQAATSATLNIIELKKPKFLQELRNLTITEGESARIDCVIVGSPEPEVLWLKEEIPIKETERLRLFFEGDRCVLQIGAGTLGDSGLYKCIARNSAGEVTSFCRLTVQPLIPMVPPRIHPHLQNQVLTVGQRCMFEVKVTGDPEPRVAWTHNGRNILPCPDFQILKDGEWHRLVISRIREDLAGEYSAKAQNDAGEAETAATMVVNEPVPPKPMLLPQGVPTSHTTFVEEFHQEAHVGASPSATAPEFFKPFPDEYRVPLGHKARLECHLVGNPRPKVTWLFNGRPIPPSGFCSLSNIGDTYSIVITETRIEHEGVYSIRAENIRGTVDSSTRLIVTGSQAPVPSPKPSPRQPPLTPVKPMVQAPHFTKTLVSVVCEENEEVRFEATATGMPHPDFTWEKDGQPISQGTNPELRFSQSEGGVRLIIPKAMMNHSGKFTVTARNAGGHAVSSAQLIVRSRTEAPDFIQRLISREVKEGDSMKWEVQVCGVPMPRVTWYRNGVAIPHCPEVQLTDEGNGRHSMYIPSIQVVDGGQFTVKADNPAGEARSTADLVIRRKNQEPGRYYHVTRVTQEQQEMGMEVSSSAVYEEKGSNGGAPAIQAPRR